MCSRNRTTFYNCCMLCHMYGWMFGWKWNVCWYYGWCLCSKWWNSLWSCCMCYILFSNVCSNNIVAIVTNLAYLLKCICFCVFIG
eukprot:UN05501